MKKTHIATEKQGPQKTTVGISKLLCNSVPSCLCGIFIKNQY